MKLALTVWGRDGVLYESTLDVRDGLPEDKAWEIVDTVLSAQGLDQESITAMDLHKIHEISCTSVMTNWTLEDLVEMTLKATQITLPDNDYCEHCTVAAVAAGEKYCTACAQEITDLLAAEYTQQGLIERGLY